MTTDTTPRSPIAPRLRSERHAGLFGTVLSMRLTHARCGRCGSILDAPRLNPGSGEIGRKCCDCDLWSPVEAALT